MARAAGRILIAAVVVAGAVASTARAAPTLESVLSPGRLTQAHAKWEDDCNACHVRFDRAAQDGLCMDCHKEVGADVRARRGYHGRLAPQACRACHTDHKGRDRSIAAFDAKRFDHTLTDFDLRGAHRGTDCLKCHEPNRRYAAAASECGACHRKDDVHKGALGLRCADCHAETRWKEARIDHDKTRFALTGRHVDARCTDCHKDTNYRETPQRCHACHRKDDDGPKGHRGQFGEKCDSCHGSKAWKPAAFSHDTDTRWPLRGKHRTPRCSDCHKGHLFRTPTPTDCLGCHRKDDVHKESLGRDCAACHTEQNWKEKARFDHARTDFPLRGGHADAACDSCHRTKVFKEVARTCFGCHRKEDRHEGTLGEDCAACHGERDWKTTAGRFDHDRTKFPLRRAHAAPKLRCAACHRDSASFRHTPLDCIGCHRRDDRHEGQQGAQCERCHDDASWKVPSFDHRRARFALVGAHLTVACKGCHASARFQDAARECIACHRKDDRHKGVFGTNCDACHNARAWSIWDYDHARRARFALEGAHRKAACAACHTRPAPAGRDAAPVGETCIACHRRDDVHDGSFGTRCESCHGSDRWKPVTNRATRMPPRGERGPEGGIPQ